MDAVKVNEVLCGKLLLVEAWIFISLRMRRAHKAVDKIMFLGGFIMGFDIRLTATWVL